MSHNNWQHNKQWSDKFIPEIKSIIGMHIISIPPIEEDQERNTDLITMKMETVRIGCRIRRYEYYLKYPNEFTIRSHLPSGSKTELAKIIEKWGDYLFYGFANENNDSLIAWLIGNLDVFRLWYNRQLAQLDKNQYPGICRKNGDGSSSFYAFNINDLPKEFIIARKQN